MTLVKESWPWLPTIRCMPRTFLHALRRLRPLAGLVLAWFVLSVGVAVASPLVNPQPLELICSGPGGFKLLAKTDEGAQEVSGHTLDCPLCATCLLYTSPSPRD